MTLSTNQKTAKASDCLSRGLSELDAAIGELQSVRASDGDADRAHALARSLQHTRSLFAVTAMSVHALAVRMRDRQ
jgi:hypothetical protein